MKTRTALLLAASLFSATALAQTQPAPGRHGAAAMAEAMSAAREAHLTKLHDDLKLTANQEAAWTAFKTAMTPPPRTAQTPVDPSTLTAPQRADRMVERAKTMLAHAQAHADAVKAFYAVLTAEQKKIFDTDTLHAGGRGHGMMGQGQGPLRQMLKKG
ncbi:Spy/CpxP family protein refolding chaperone [Massilia sp. TS11]|uniref:Spy/CpxP family protein refolding chaperone n=1 Tax=Massilia sp. TS11 TaxID=2908003 RepID=UPI001EDA8461|nr:Spy/CpxP family protein refolding chaperone [Massilia sp. TS11]MCG2584890.1 Spy/CpxP family protein refolding chaperone [Massilia sp. TS11]